MYHHHQSAEDMQFRNQFGGWGRGCGRGPWGRKFGGHMPWMKHFSQLFGNRIPVNIEETDEAYQLHMYASGLEKQHIRLSVKNDVLTIAYEAPEQSGGAGQFAHREYEAGSFERQFQLNGKVLTASISAAYNDGILKVTLPKDPATNQPAQHVTVL